MAASLVSLGAASIPAAGAAASAPRSDAPSARLAAALTAAQAGAGWIARDVSPSGAVIDAYSGKESPAETAAAILALVAAGEGANQVTAAVHWLERHFGPYVAVAGVDDPGRLGLVILAAVAAGARPAAFGGHRAANDLVARLTATERLRGRSAGRFHAGVSSNAFSQSYALLALVAVKAPRKDVALASTYLASRQCGDGGWEYVRASVSEPCARPNPTTYSGPDTNSTALAVMAIRAAGGHAAHDPLAFFERSQEADGSFGYIGVAGHGQAGDADSTAEVVQALIALGALHDRQFVRHGITPLRALVAFQYRCGAPASQRGELSAYGAPSQFATLQAVPALAGSTFPIVSRSLSVAEPRLSCSAR
jgi:hypothetical protein